MRAFSDYESTPEFTTVEKLPAGAYVVKIARAEERDDALCILLDIAEGKFKGYFMEKFNDEKKKFPEEAKYKGVYRLRYSKEGDKYYETNKSRMKTVLKIIKEENKLNVDFSKEWDGKALQGAKVAMIFRDEEYNYMGYHGFNAKPYGVIPMENYKSGKFTIPEPKRLKASQSADVDDFTEASDVSTEEDLPF